jgi:hypothetical protein
MLMKKHQEIARLKIRVVGRRMVMLIKKNTGYLFILSLLFVFGAGQKANAQGWPTFDVAHTVSEVTAMVGDINKTIQKPMEIMSFKNVTKSLGPLGASQGGKLMGNVKTTMGDTLKKVKIKPSKLSNKSKGSMDNAVKAVEEDENLFAQEDGERLTQAKLQRIKKERKEMYKDAATEAYALALVQKARGAEGTDEKVASIIEKAQTAEDKRGAYSANTLAIIEVCNELMMTANLEVSKLKLEASQALSNLKDVSLSGDIKPSKNN